MRRGAAQALRGLVCAAALLARGAAAAAPALPAMGIPPGTGAWLGVSIDFGVYPRCAPTRRLSWARWASFVASTLFQGTGSTSFAAPAALPC